MFRRNNYFFFLSKDENDIGYSNPCAFMEDSGGITRKINRNVSYGL